LGKEKDKHSTQKDSSIGKGERQKRTRGDLIKFKRIRKRPLGRKGSSVHMLVLRFQGGKRTSKGRPRPPGRGIWTQERGGEELRQPRSKETVESALGVRGGKRKGKGGYPMFKHLVGLGA